MEEPSFSRVFFTLSAVSRTVLFWCQHSVVIRRISRILYGGVCVWGSVGGIGYVRVWKEKEQDIQGGPYISRWTESEWEGRWSRDVCDGGGGEEVE